MQVETLPPPPGTVQAPSGRNRRSGDRQVRSPARVAIGPACERTVVAVEVKSGRSREHLPGMAMFAKEFKPLRVLLLGEGGIALEEFFTRPAAYWLSSPR